MIRILTRDRKTPSVTNIGGCQLDAPDWAFEAFLDCLNDPEFDGPLMMAVEELYQVPIADLDWMLP